MSNFLSRRREFLFLYDIRMGNPNGDPDENRPRRLPDGTFYVTDVRLKRFVRDWLKTQGEQILVDRPEDAATNLTGRVKSFLENKPGSVREECEAYFNISESLRKAGSLKSKKTNSKKKPKGSDPDEAISDDSALGDQAEVTGDEDTEGDPKTNQLKVEQGRLVVTIILKSFIDARLFGSSLAFKNWDIAPRPKTLTGAVQINMGEVLHQAHEVDIAGTSIFASKEGNETGTFTTYHGLRYGLIGFNGIANEHSAVLSQLTDDDYERFLRAVWKSVSSAPTANTRSKVGQVPRLLVDVTYQSGSEFQFGCLLNYARVEPHGRAETAIASPDDYVLNVERLVERLKHPCIEKVRYALHDDMKSSPEKLPWEKMDLDSMPTEVRGV